MDFKDFYAGMDDDSRRLDRIVKRMFQDNPGVNVQEIIRKKLVRLNQKKASPGDKVSNGDVISVAAFLLEKKIPMEPADDYSDDDMNLDLIFKNPHIIFVNKPKGISVQGGEEKKCVLSDLVAKKYPGSGDSLSFRAGPLHRLDKNTTGLLAFSQSQMGARWFSEMIQNHSIKKTYIALAEGKLLSKSTWVDFIDDTPCENRNGFHTVRIITETDSTGKKAVTHATPLAHGIYNGKDVTLVQFDIETGRKHQIRCQSSFHGHPLLGDNAYNGHGNTFYLHAARLIFPDDNPLGLPRELLCEMPKDFKEILKFCLINWDGKLIIL